MKTEHTPGPIHAIIRWSGEQADEIPLCGANKNNPMVWGKRTIYLSSVTCKHCLTVIAKAEGKG